MINNYLHVKFIGKKKGMNNILRKNKEEENNDYKKLNCVVNWSLFISFFL